MKFMHTHLWKALSPRGVHHRQRYQMLAHGIDPGFSFGYKMIGNHWNPGIVDTYMHMRGNRGGGNKRMGY